MHKGTKCLTEYNRGLEARRQAPLHTGRYKLAEVEGHIDSYNKNLCELAHCRRMKQPLTSLDAGNQPGTYIKKIPTWMSFEAGWRLMPAIEALVGDGVPERRVREAIRDLQPRVIAVLEECQSTLNRLQTHGVQVEYAAWDEGFSLFHVPFDMYINIKCRADELLAYAGPRPATVLRPTALRNLIIPKTLR